MIYNYVKNTENLTMNIIEDETIKPIDLLQEIEPLLKEYFVGGFEIKDDSIILSFNNGQQFRLVIEEVC